MKQLVSTRFTVVLMLFLSMAAAGILNPAGAIGSCAAPVNAIEAENCKPGSPSGEWDINGAGDLTIQGFATDISVNKGETVRFKVLTDAGSYRLDIYRIGYYGGDGARKVATVQPSATLPQAQPACVDDPAAKLTDCGNWLESASWAVPADAVSGVYIARLVRTDTGGASHIIFIVRDDNGGSDLLFKTSDTTWQAYNSYGLGFIEYPDYGYPSKKATKASYNRPFLTRAANNGLGAYNWFFQSEYPLVRWLEANGYNVSYFTSLDADRRGAQILAHKVLLSVGHDEYWSARMRTNVEAARAAGVHLAFFSGNEIYRKIRWENSIDGSGTAYRTMVCYNESNAPAPVDPVIPPVWTGTWRNPTFSPPLDGGRPENALSGTLFTVSSGPTDLGISLQVPQENGRMRFWRNTAAASLAAGQTTTLGDRVVGYEFNEDVDNGFRPPGLMQLSSTTTPVSAKLLGNNVNIAADVYLPGTATHVMTLYRDASSALVFSAGTVHWSWGLDGRHDNGPSVPDPGMRQATVNLFADMGIQPAALQAGLAAAAVSTDKNAPVSAITYPAAAAAVPLGSPLTISGTASDSGGGVVGGVEISTDGGISWHPAAGRENWSYLWSPAAAGVTVIRSRAVDDSGNLETAAAGVSITITAANPSPYTIWRSTAVPGLVDGGADAPVELGVKFRSDADGFASGIRFYKAGANTGIHTGSLWTISGTRLATATFADESASGWQQVDFTTPVAISANTDYVASYHVNGGHYSADINYFTGREIDSPPLHALASGVSGANGVYAYGTASNFPTQSWYNANYWVDVVVSRSPPATLANIELLPANPTVAIGSTRQFTATGTYSDGSTQDVTARSAWASTASGVATVSSTGLATAVSAGSSTVTATFGGVTGSSVLAVPTDPLKITTASLPDATPNSSYSASLTASGGTVPYSWTIAGGVLPPGLTLDGVTGSVSGTPASAAVFSFTIRVTDSGSPQQTITRALNISVSPQAEHTLWPESAVPGLVDSGPDSSVELGVKFRADIGGYITGIRFYKAAANSGTHVGSLWTDSGTQLASAAFGNETASGWQQVNFATPVAITAATVYVASYHTNAGHYSDDIYYFAGTGKDTPPLHALADGVSGYNGVYAYGSGSTFPRQGWKSSNYWVDVVFSATATSDTTAPTVTAFIVPATAASLTVAIDTLTATDSGGVTGYLVNEAAVVPSAAAGGWSSTAPASYLFATEGNKTLFAWARDAAGNVSASRSVNVTVILPDITKPTVTAFTIPATSASLIVPVSSFNATDNVAVTGYLVTETAAAPTTAASGWSAEPHSSYTFTAEGSKTLHAWVRDAAGNISSDRSASVVVSLPLDKPILIITSAANPFTGYYAEILRAEGFNYSTAMNIPAVTATLLAGFDLAIIGEMPLSSAQVAMFDDWVNAGGHLIAMRPDSKLAALLGLNNLGASLSEGYLLVNTLSGPGAGIVNQTIQYHGAADLYSLKDTSSVAALYSTAATATSNPAVTLRNVGSMGGKAAAFTYDLARSVVYTRQGNPAWSGQERDGYPPIRSDDLFYGNAGTDPKPDWVDLNKVAIPQADEQQRLLANLIIQMNLDRRLLPRFWYFPDSLPAVVVMTGDDHNGSGTIGRFDDYKMKSPQGCSVQEWECVRSTSYIYSSNPYITPEQVASYTSEGFEVALHLNTGCTDWTPATLQTFYAEQFALWNETYPDMPLPVTNRTHCIVWSDYSTLPSVEQANGVGLDTTYYFWPSSWVANKTGFFSGSGMPMKFTDADGDLINVFQLATQMTDESGQDYPLTIDTLLNRAIGTEGYYGAFTANMHTDIVASSDSDAIVTSARTRGIPVISARQMLDWLNGRNAAMFNSINWNGTTLSFSVSSATAARGLTAMVPVPADKSVAQVNRDGGSIPFTTATIKGIRYATFAAADGAYQVSYAAALPDSVPPTVTSFAIPASYAALKIPVTSLTAADNEAVTGYLVTETAAAPLPTSGGWSLSPPEFYTFASTGSKTLYAWARDAAGNVSAGRSSNTTISAAAAYSLWPSAAAPVTIDSGPDSAVELGVKFRTDSSGLITGIRFYKAGANTGTHVANLWTSAGMLLATATFSSETASGWQQVLFSAPIAVAANTTYIASYHAGNGHYSCDQNYFVAAGVDRAPLHAPVNTASAPNGVYAYGSVSKFPNQGWNSSNYWVDVLFQLP